MTNEQPPRSQPTPRAERATAPTRRGGGSPPARLSAARFAVLAAAVVLAVVYATGQVLPPTSAHQAEMRVWLASRAAGFTALGLLTVQVVLGLVLSHPTNKTTWRLSKRVFPWHENAWVFVLAFLAVHVVALVLDPYAGVGLGGALLPGLSSYRTAPVALGTMAMWALLATGLSARYTKLLPAGVWLSLHRLSIVVFALAWMHGMLAGTDTDAVRLAYLIAAAAVIAAGGYRYWASRLVRPTFATSITEGPRA